jgi:hypothetical protein
VSAAWTARRKAPRAENPTQQRHDPCFAQKQGEFTLKKPWRLVLILSSVVIVGVVGYFGF